MPFVDPKTERIGNALDTDRGLPVGVNAFRAAFMQETSAKAFSEWANNPITKLFRGAVQDLLVNGPSHGIGSDSIPVHYGMTVAFSVVAQLFDNPGLVIPGMFSLKDGQPAPVPLSDIPDDYGTSIEDELDRKG